MKHVRLVISIAVAATISALFASITGCESDGDTGSGLDAYFAANPYVSDPRTTGDTANGGLSLSPETAQATTIGQKVLFTISGGDSPYSWAVASSAAGSITAQSGNDAQAIYTCITVAKNNVIVSDANGYAAIGEITTGTTPSIQITPSSWDVTGAGALVFTASGGTPPYSWAVVSSAAGTIAASGTQNQTGTYSPISFTATNSIVATDSLGNSAQATVY